MEKSTAQSSDRLRRISIRVVLNSPITLLYALFDLSLREVALKRAQIVNEELPIEMVRLVRNAASLKVHHVESHLAAHVCRNNRGTDRVCLRSHQAVLQLIARSKRGDRSLLERLSAAEHTFPSYRARFSGWFSKFRD